MPVLVALGVQGKSSFVLSDCLVHRREWRRRMRLRGRDVCESSGAIVALDPQLGIAVIVWRTKFRDM
jgi:hypothetical protein